MSLHHEHFKSRVSVPYSPVAFLDICYVGLQSQTFWGLISPVHVPDTGHKTFASQGRVPYLCNPSQLPITVLGVRFWQDCVSPSPTHLNVAFLSLVVEELVTVFRSFSEGSVPYAAIDLVCPWEEVIQDLPTPPS